MHEKCCVNAPCDTCGTVQDFTRDTPAGARLCYTCLKIKEVVGVDVFDHLITIAQYWSRRSTADHVEMRHSNFEYFR